METLLKFLNSIYPLSHPLKEYLKQTLKMKEVPEGNYILKGGWVCDKICFIEKGLFRCYYYEKEKEVCSWFMKENDVMLSVFSFFDQLVSYEYIQSLEDSIVWYINHKEYEYVKHNFLEFNIIRAELLEQSYKISEQRTFSLRKRITKDRFQFLFEHNRDLIQRVPSKDLASYLGMNPSTFSRNKKKYFREQVNDKRGKLHRQTANRSMEDGYMPYR